jgi:heme exporter protein B
LFGGVLGLNRAFATEVDDGGWGAILVSPVPKDALFFGKVLSTFTLMILVEGILLSLMIVMFDLQINWPAMLLVSFMALLGFSVLGTLFSAISVFTRAQEVMLPILFLPLISPVIIAAVECSGQIFMGGDIFEVIDWVGFMGALNLLYIVLCPFCFGLTLKQ